MMETRLLGALVEVKPDPTVTAEGVSQDVLQGRIVSTFLRPIGPSAMPGYVVQLDSGHIIDCDGGRLRVLDWSWITTK